MNFIKIDRRSEKGKDSIVEMIGKEKKKKKKKKKHYIVTQH